MQIKYFLQKKRIFCIHLFLHIVHIHNFQLLLSHFHSLTVTLLEAKIIYFIFMTDIQEYEYKKGKSNSDIKIVIIHLAQFKMLPVSPMYQCEYVYISHTIFHLKVLFARFDSYIYLFIYFILLSLQIVMIYYIQHRKIDFIYIFLTWTK